MNFSNFLMMLGDYSTQHTHLKQHFKNKDFVDKCLKFWRKLLADADCCIVTHLRVGGIVDLQEDDAEEVLCQPRGRGRGQLAPELGSLGRLAAPPEVLDTGEHEAEVGVQDLPLRLE